MSDQNTILDLFKDQPKYRLEQFYRALFDPSIKSWSDISTLPKALREQLTDTCSFYSFKLKKILKGADNMSVKAVLETPDNLVFESVLMQNRRGQYTVCVSSQIGCKLGCTFCATGKMGFKRDLTVSEIIDQLRFWQSYGHKEIDGFRISNLVFMGMGEPFDNYTNVVEAINTILEYTDIGRTKVTISTVGLIEKLEELLTDPNWPKVRIALSLQSTEFNKRKKLVPSTEKDFFQLFRDWAIRYLEQFGNRRNYLTFEYVLIADQNDSEKDAKFLAEYTIKCDVKKINLIPYNENELDVYSKSDQSRTDEFQAILEKKGLDVTVRRSLGKDIGGACGQLVGKIK